MNIFDALINYHNTTVFQILKQETGDTNKAKEMNDLLDTYLEGIKGAYSSKEYEEALLSAKEVRRYIESCIKT